ncbi:MAG: Hsp33 family molecular chaperone HslO [Burkholderiaceae bacterium]|uniref:Hsp33 family molecular chaperone HslO n=1 Tax=Herminiimonas contaminans TaxID=1111140 RepID=A0ABS0EUW8_9BURK|nr:MULTISPECIES: Hsp33 family molecular chaperone HslO [Oxalobacteraceae]MBF8176983.1 Hsp33 family molecular chaperone HslO [Herminiimonas contaminans]MBX9799788.1 Hsp33 family molecular chaperone HslO [Burkholderiaceae bacterium]
MTDTLQKFMFENTAVRGELVDVSETWKHVQARREYPAAVKTILGEMLSAAALLSANLKFNGAIVMQIHGDGPLRLLVVECDSDLNMRATAKLADSAVIADDTTLTQLVNQNGSGRFVITLDPKDKLPGQQAYQGIVPLDGESVATVIENYMMRSEQLDTRLWLAADGNVSRGLLLQKLPGEGGIKSASGEEMEPWDRSVMLASTLRTEELLSTDIETVMRRLFWEEDIRIFDPKHPHFLCSCTREKVGSMLKMLGQAEVETALEEMGKLAIDCDFCGQHYEFDPVDCAQLFVSEAPVETLIPASPSKH